jgi:hypothetical protein
MAKKGNCVQCGKKVNVGINATFVETSGDNYDLVCDECRGVERDPNGFAWLPGETEKLMEDFHGLQTNLTRAEAFKQ